MDQFRKRFNQLPFFPAYFDFDENHLLEDWKQYRMAILQNHSWFGDYGLDKPFDKYGISEGLNKSLDYFESKKDKLIELSEKQFRHEMKTNGVLREDINDEINFFVYRIEKPRKK